MNLFRVLLLLVAAYLIWRIWQRFFVTPATAPPKDDYLPTARCSKCGAHVAAGTLSSKGVCGRCTE